jgi:hypothetical protein
MELLIRQRALAYVSRRRRRKAGISGGVCGARSTTWAFDHFAWSRAASESLRFCRFPFRGSILKQSTLDVFVHSIFQPGADSWIITQQLASITHRDVASNRGWLCMLLRIVKHYVRMNNRLAATIDDRLLARSWHLLDVTVSFHSHVSINPN